MENSQILIEQAEAELRIRNYSPKTIKSYLHFLREYFAFLSEQSDEINETTIKRYMLELEHKGASSQTRNLCLSALKFYYRQVMGVDAPMQIRTAKRSQSLPVVLSRNEIIMILNITKNRKHRLMLALGYGAGLRVSEVVSLRVHDLDLSEMTVHIKQAKGRKDRISVFPPAILSDMRRFLIGKATNEFVFASDWDGQLTTRTAQKIFEHARNRAGIVKPATFHSLRHSFATHLIENGVDIRYVQELLGHANIRTTQRYTQVTNPKLKSITSPLL